MRGYRGALLATTSGLVVAGGAAQAADMPVKAAPAYIPAANWTGFYIGAHAGAAWTRGALSSTAYSAVSDGTQVIDSSVFIGGGQVGYNWQKGNALFGIEIDFSGLSKGNEILHSSLAKGVVHRQDIKWLATFRGRMGLVVNDTMAYVTGGLAVGGVENHLAPNGNGPNTGTPKSENKTKVGWVVGGGIEHMWTRNWTVALEGLFVDLGKSSVAPVSTSGSTLSAADIQNKTTRFTNQAVIGRFKLNYKF